MSDELDLFSWVPQSAVILAFPLSRNLVRVRLAVANLEKCRTAISRQRTFDRQLWDLCQLLTTYGISSDQIDRQLTEFTNAVNAELWQNTRRQRPGGAA